MSNPNMMYFFERLDTPLIDLEVQAWLLLAQIIGDISLPTQEEMKGYNIKSFLESLEEPYCREYAEENYRKRWWKVDDDHWSYNTSDKRSKQMNKTYLDLQFRVLARDMVDCKYPLQIGTHQKLNEKGKALVLFNEVCGYARYDLDEESPDASWRTFRDCNPAKCYSIMTGTKTVPLKCHWLDLQGQSKDDIVDNSTTKQKKKSVTGMLKEKLRLR